jgi:hypothetical protein
MLDAFAFKVSRITTPAWAYALLTLAIRAVIVPFPDSDWYTKLNASGVERNPPPPPATVNVPFA